MSTIEPIHPFEPLRVAPAQRVTPPRKRERDEERDERERGQQEPRPEEDDGLPHVDIRA
jgi:hypothetical protein